MSQTFTIHNSENDCVVRITKVKPDASTMRLLVGAKTKRIVMTGGTMFYRSDSRGLPLNHAAVSILEGDGSDEKIYGNVVIIAQNGLQPFD